MKITVDVNVDLEAFFDQWGTDSLKTCILDEVKRVVMGRVKDSQEYKKMCEKQYDSMMDEIFNR